MRKKLLSAILASLLIVCVGADEWQPSSQWGKGKTIRFFVGGEAGDTFSGVVYRGARQAEMDLGVKVEYVFSGWSLEKMTAQFREAVAAKPDGIAMMGHAGDAALMPIAQQARDAGIKVMCRTAMCPGSGPSSAAVTSASPINTSREWT